MLIMLLFAVWVYENRSTLYCANEHLKQRICHVCFITAIGFSKSSVMFVLEKGRKDFQRKLIIRTVQSLQAFLYLLPWPSFKYCWFSILQLTASPNQTENCDGIKYE